MSQVYRLDSLDRQRAKQAAREQDDHDLRNGNVSRADLRARNGFFSSIDLANSSVRRRVAR